jgi:hypothetical protein
MLAALSMLSDNSHMQVGVLVVHKIRLDAKSLQVAGGKGSVRKV